MDARGEAAALPDGAFAPFGLLGPVGSRPAGAYLVRQSGQKGALLVAEHFAGVANGPEGESRFLREARRIAILTNLNVARVHSVSVRGADVAAFGELVEGERLVELWTGSPLPLEVTLRWILDVLSGLATLHTLRDAKQQPLKLAHGEVSPSTVAVGVDGVARLLHAISRRAPGATADPASFGYMAPEVLAGEPYDARADVFGAGALLWEALDGGRLLPEGEESAIVARVRSGPLPAPAVSPKVAWAKGLAEVAVRALAASPDDRWPTAAAMAAELRKAAGLKLAPASTAAAFTRSALADRAKARKERLLAAEAAAVTAPPPPAKPATPRAPAVAAPVVIDEISGVESVEPSEIRVAPAGAAAAAEVVELGSESLLDAPESVPPPSATPASALGGFVIDPFASGPRRAGPSTPTGVPTTPAPLPPPTIALPPPTIGLPQALATPHISEITRGGPTHDPSAESGPISGAPAFASAMATPSAGAAPAAPTVTTSRSPTVKIQRPPLPASALGGADGSRRTVIVAGAAVGVVLLGVVVVRLMSRDAHDSAASTVASTIAAPGVPATSNAVPVADLASPSPALADSAPAAVTASAPATPAPKPSAATGPARPVAPRPAAPATPAKRRTSFTPDTL